MRKGRRLPSCVLAIRAPISRFRNGVAAARRVRRARAHAERIAAGKRERARRHAGAVVCRRPLRGRRRCRSSSPFPRTPTRHKRRRYRASPMRARSTPKRSSRCVRASWSEFRRRRGSSSRCAARGVAVVLLPDDTFASIFSNLRAIGALTHREREAAATIARLRRETAAIQRERAGSCVDRAFSSCSAPCRSGRPDRRRTSRRCIDIAGGAQRRRGFSRAVRTVQRRGAVRAQPD